MTTPVAIAYNPPQDHQSETQLKRDFTLFSAFSLAFAYISPIVAVYGVFALGVGLVGPGYWLAIPVALCGQLLVAYALGEVASKHPHEGSLYAWAGRLLGPTYGWFTGWAYLWTVLIALVTVAVGGAQFWGAALGIDLSSKWSLIAASIVVLAFATGCNLWSRRALRIMIVVSICAEVVGSVGLGAILLIGYHVNPLSAIFGGGPGGAGGLSASSWLLAIALAGWSFLGFESSGAIAEEVEDAEHNVPKALRYSLLAIAAIVLFASLALILSIPDLHAVLAGKDTDPVGTTLTTHLGSGLPLAWPKAFSPSDSPPAPSACKPASPGLSGRSHATAPCRLRRGSAICPNATRHPPTPLRSRPSCPSRSCC